MLTNKISNIKHQIFSSKIERPKSCHPERTRNLKILIDKQKCNHRLNNLMKRFNQTSQALIVNNSQNENTQKKYTFTLSKNDSKCFRGKLPKIKFKDNYENDENKIHVNEDKKRSELTPRFGNPVLWLKNNKRKCEEEKVVLLPKNNNDKDTQQYKSIALLNKFNSLCNLKTANQGIMHKERQNSIINEIDEQIVNLTNSSANIPVIQMNSSSNTYKENEKSDKSGVYFKTLSKKMDLDHLLQKVLHGAYFDWIPGEILYEGSTSIVYKGLNINTGGIVIAKKYIDKKYLDIFNNEVKIYSIIKNDNIINYYGNEMDTVANNYFIYMQYASGGNLKQLIETYGPLPENLIRKYVYQIAKALEYLHKEKHIAHRDIKCGNILIDSEGNIKLSDFGCAEVDNNNSLKELKGTLLWCAPEVICGKNYGVKCDIWSLGCAIIEMAGALPWGGTIDNYYQCMNIIGKGKEIPEIPTDFSNDLKDFVSLCLKRDVEERANIDTLINHIFLK